MKSLYPRIIPAFLGAFLLLSFMPMSAIAATKPDVAPDCIGKKGVGIFKNAYNGTPDGAPCIIDSFKDVFVIGANILQLLLLGALGLFILFFLLGGFKYVTSNGIPDRVKEAKDTILNAIVGLVIILLAYLIIGFVSGGLGGSVTPTP